MEFENSKELLDFVEKFCGKLLKPKPKDVVVDFGTGEVFLSWEGYKFLINLDLNVDEELIEGTEEYTFKTPQAKLLQAALKEHYSKKELLKGIGSLIKSSKK